MDSRLPMPRRPVRAAVIAAGVIALVGSGSAFIPGVSTEHALALAFGYGAILGLYVIGLVLASGLSATRWWWASAMLPFASLMVVAIGLARWPEAVLRWWWLIGNISLSLIALWLSVGSFLAVLGWWSYARHYREAADA